MEGKRIPKRLLEWKPTGRRNRGRTRKRRIEDIEEDIQIMGIRRRRKLCKEREEWKKITEKWVVTPVKEEEDDNHTLPVCNSVSTKINLEFTTSIHLRITQL